MIGHEAVRNYFKLTFGGGARNLLERGDSVSGADNLNDYYDVSLKQARLDRLRGAGVMGASVSSLQE